MKELYISIYIQSNNKFRLLLIRWCLYAIGSTGPEHKILQLNELLQYEFIVQYFIRLELSSRDALSLSKVRMGCFRGREETNIAIICHFIAIDEFINSIEEKTWASFSYPCNSSGWNFRIAFGGNFRNGYFDGFTRYEVPWLRKSHF